MVLSTPGPGAMGIVLKGRRVNTMLVINSSCISSSKVEYLDVDFFSEETYIGTGQNLLGN